MTNHTPLALHGVAQELGIEQIVDQLLLPVANDVGYHLLAFSGGTQLTASIRWTCNRYRSHHQQLTTAASRAPLVPLSKLASYAAQSFCTDCADVPSMQWLGRNHSGLSSVQQEGAQAIEVARAELARRSVLRRDGKPSKSANVIQRQRDQFEDVLRTLTFLQAHANPKPTGILRDAFVEVEDRTRTDLQRLKGLQKSPDITERLHEQIRSASGLQPDWVVDSTPTLVGFAPYRGSNRLVRAVVESAKLAETKQTVIVLVPAWVSHFLIHTDRSQHVQAVAAPDEELARTAAVLWDPTQEGPLGSLAGALEVAGELDRQ